MLEVEAFDRWRFSVDRQATLEAYSQIDEGSAEQCQCGDCLNWLQYRAASIPRIVRSFFEQVGIDFSKESEVSEFEGGPDESLYIGEYHFVGNVISGPDPFVPTPNGDGCSIEPTEVFPNFKLGLSSSWKWGAPVPKTFGELPVVTVVFEVRTSRDSSFD